MRSTIILSSILICSLFLLPSLDKGETSPYHPGIERSGGPADVLNQDRTGSPISVGTCTACHGGGAYDPTIDIDVINEEGELVSSYSPGETYTLAFTVTSTVGVAGGYGMQSVILDAENAQAGIFGIPTSANTQISSIGTRDYLEHDGVASGGMSYIFSTPWTAPTSGTGDVTLYYIGLAVNGTGSTSGDDVTTPEEITISEDEEPSISYPDGPFCNNESSITPIIIGETTGSFSAEAGLDIDETTGVISPVDSDFGIYTVSYSFGEPASIVTTEVSILETYETFSEIEICTGETIEYSGTTFSDEDEGLNILFLTAENTCDSIINLNIIVNDLPLVAGNVSNDTICLGESVTFTGSGTATSYNWTAPVEDGIPYTPTFSGLMTFTVTGTSLEGCNAEDEVFLFVNAVSLFSIVNDVIVGNDGSIDITPSGFPPFSFDWDNDGTGDFDDTEDLTDLNEGTYTVTVRDNLNCEAEETFIIDSQAGIENNNWDNTFLVYPNPTNEFVTIERKGSFTYSITDTKGALIKAGKGNNSIILSLSDIDVGNYFITITSKNNTNTQTLIKE